MKTADQIKKGLECCSEVSCEGCPYHGENDCSYAVVEDGLCYIRQLEKITEEQEQIILDQGVQLDVLPRWIPVTERLPENNATCLITIREKWDGKIEHHVDVATKTDEGRGYIDGLWDTDNDWIEGQEEICVTHWMPLPSAAEEVS